MAARRVRRCGGLRGSPASATACSLAALDAGGPPARSSASCALSRPRCPHCERSNRRCRVELTERARARDRGGRDGRARASCAPPPAAPRPTSGSSASPALFLLSATPPALPDADHVGIPTVQRVSLLPTPVGREPPMRICDVSGMKLSPPLLKPSSARAARRSARRPRRGRARRARARRLGEGARRALARAARATAARLRASCPPRRAPSASRSRARAAASSSTPRAPRASMQLETTASPAGRPSSAVPVAPIGRRAPLGHAPARARACSSRALARRPARARMPRREPARARPPPARAPRWSGRRRGRAGARASGHARAEPRSRARARRRARRGVNASARRDDEARRRGCAPARAAAIARVQSRRRARWRLPAARAVRRGCATRWRALAPTDVAHVAARALNTRRGRVRGDAAPCGSRRRSGRGRDPLARRATASAARARSRAARHQWVNEVRARFSADDPTTARARPARRAAPRARARRRRSTPRPSRSRGSKSEDPPAPSPVRPCSPPLAAYSSRLLPPAAARADRGSSSRRELARDPRSDLEQRWCGCMDERRARTRAARACLLARAGRRRRFHTRRAARARRRAAALWVGVMRCVRPRSESRGITSAAPAAWDPTLPFAPECCQAHF